MKRHRFPIEIAVVVLCAFTGAVCVSAQEKPLDNAEIIRLTKADMGDDIIVGKIKASKAVKFDIETDDLVKLKEAGVSKAVITAMLDRMALPATARGASSASEVQVALKSTDNSVDLTHAYGLKEQSVVPFRGPVGWLKYDGATASVRTKDRRPSLELASEGDPTKSGWYWVQLDQNGKGSEAYRSFDLNTKTGAWTATLSADPDKGVVVAVSVAQASPGVWRLTPDKPLKPGEYGLYYRVSEKQILYAFGIDK